MSSSFRQHVLFCTAVLFLAGCGGGSTTLQAPPPPAPVFTSTPNTAAEEGVEYSYTVTVTFSGNGPVSLALTTAPAGASLSSATITWTPTHAQSRTSNSFTLTAGQGNVTATQSWTVTPTGNVNITAVTTYWTPAGSINVNPTWQANLTYPAALVPQTDGSLQRLQGAANPDASFSIPNVPAGFYWLQINPNANFWTSASDFDFGQDLLGRPGATTAETTTTFDYSISGLNSTSGLENFLIFQTDVRGLELLSAVEAPSTSTFDTSFIVTSNIDWSQITAVYASQYLQANSGNFNGFVLGPSQTIPNLVVTNGTTNQISADLSAGSAASLPLTVDGTAWAPLASNVGPGNPSPTYSDFSVFVQPYVNDRYATFSSISQFGPDFAFVRPANPSTNPVPTPSLYGCEFTVGTFVPALPAFGVAPITTDVNYGTLSYNDPYPSDWLRVFQYCQASSVNLPRPGSNGVTDAFIVGTNETTALPSGAVTPILSSVQSPTINGTSLLQLGQTLNTTTLNLSWSAPAIGQPFGYFVEVFQLATIPPPASGTGYIAAGNYATTQTSLTIPFISANNAYVFSIVAASDAKANLETSPLRHRLPIAESGVVSAPIVIAPGATSSAMSTKR